MSFHGDRPPLPSLTGIRFIAAFLVVLFHANIEIQTSGARHNRGVPELTHGYIGVSLFFVLSGFILTYTYLRADSTLRGARWSFWRARFARVYPTYVFALLLSAPLFVKRFAAAPVSSFEAGHAVLGALLTPVLLQAWWPTAACQWNCAGWSLSVEAFFYAMFPILAVWLARRSHIRALIAATAIWLASLACPLLYLWITPDGVAHVTEASKLFWLTGLKYNPLVHVGEFSVGILAGLTFLRRSASETSAMMRVWIALTILACIVVLVSSPWLPYPLLHSGVLAPLFAILIYSLACRDTRGARTVVSSPVMVRLGECSYALYLLHPSIIAYSSVIARHVGVAGNELYAVLALSIACSIAASMFVFDRIEEPARRWLRSREQRTENLPHTAISLPSVALGEPTPL
jgi:peptidoglycan/LPS O-acetylase OafA/YrhL